MNHSPNPESSNLASHPKPQRRQHRSRDQWAALISQQAGSGLNVVEFCQQHNLGIASFYAWRRRLTASADEQPPQPTCDQAPSFVRLETTAQAVDPIVAEFPGGVRLTLTESVLPVFVAALRESDPC